MVHVAIGVQHNKRNSATKKPVSVIGNYVPRAKKYGSIN